MLYLNVLKKSYEGSKKLPTLINLGIAVLGSSIFFANEYYKGAIVFALVYLGFILLTDVSRFVETFRSTDEFKAKKEKLRILAEIHEKKLKKAEELEVCKKEVEELERNIDLVQDEHIKDIVEGFKEKLVLVIKQDHQYLSRVTKLNKIVLKGLEIIDLSKLYLGKEHVEIYDLYIRNLTDYVEEESKSIDILLKTIKAKELEEIAERKSQYQQDINNLFGK